MTERAFNEPLFVVDNAEGGRNGLGYLRASKVLARDGWATWPQNMPIATPASNKD
jgi:hypothetical protein